MQGHKSELVLFFDVLNVFLVFACFTSGCTSCSPVKASGKFSGFSSVFKKADVVRNSVGVIEFDTPDSGKLTIELPPASLPKTQEIKIITGKSVELDEEFKSHPYTTNLKKLDGALTITLGNLPPAQPVRLCLDRSRVFKDYRQGELIPLVHSFYDGEDETLSYFTQPNEFDREESGQKCLILEPNDFSNLDNSNGDFEAIVVFAKKEREE